MRRDPTFQVPAEGHVDVLLNFADEPVNLYQVRQWYGPLELLARSYSVAILCNRPRTARIVERETDLKVVLAPGFMNLREVRERLTPKVVLYPNQNYNNYAMLGISSAQHVFISHGESDKIYMASNWMKVFNYFFVAGQASRERLAKHLLNYDVEARTIEIGRPQIDMPRPGPEAATNRPITVLYAPTWEGGRPSMRYGSVATHAHHILTGLLGDPRFRVIYRPHPRTGVQDPETARANDAAKSMVSAAIAEDPDAQHCVDDGVFGWQLDVADVMITDISAVAYDWLTTGKPVLITRPSAPETHVTDAGFIADMPMLAANESDQVVRKLDELMSDEDLARRLRKWADFYYGDRTPGASMARFHHAIQIAVEEQESWVNPDVDGAPATASGMQPLRDFANNASETVLRRISRTKGGIQAAASVAAVEHSAPVDIVVCSMAGPSALSDVLNRLPELEQLSRRFSMAFVVGNYLTYRRLKRLTHIPVYLGSGNGQTEFITKTLSPFAVLYLEQAKHNLRETAYHGMFHVFLGNGRNSWINSRLRGFDYVLVPDARSRKAVLESFGNFPRTSTVLDLSDLAVGGLPRAMALVQKELMRARKMHPTAFKSI